MRTMIPLAAGAPPGRGGLGLPRFAPASRPVDPQWELDLNNPMRRMGFLFALGLIFVRFSMVGDLLAHVLHVNVYLLYLTTIPALLGFVASGGIRRALSNKPLLLWCGFVAWMIICIPFSVWRGASAGYLSVYIRTVLPILFVAGGLAMNWRECRLVVQTLAVAGAFNAVASYVFIKDAGSGRFGSGFTGTIGNPNDLAAHLLFLLPYFVFWAIAARVPATLRLLGWPALGLALFWILASGSRGALIALLVASGLFLWRLSLTQSLATLAGGALLALLLLPAVPRTVLNRALSVFGEHEGTLTEQQEAAESANIRKRLLRKSIEFTVRHPVFGVGPFQFGNADGIDSRSQVGGAYTERSLWFPAHNSFTTVSAESGIPAFLFFIGALLLTLREVRRAAKLAKQSNLTEIATALVCFEVSLLSFSVAIFFVNFTYYFHLPTVVGFGTLMAQAAVREVTQASAPVPQAEPAPASSALPAVRPRPANRFLRPGGRN